MILETVSITFSRYKNTHPMVNPFSIDHVLLPLLPQVLRL